MKRALLVALMLAAPLAAWADVARVRVMQPANGATLAGGSTAIISWSGPIAHEPDIEEWEAFLSVDGGRYYSARITPHLDIAIHEFRWSVPNIASRDVRILLRFGNEQNEHAIELPLSLTIEPSLPQTIPTNCAATLGEPARPGDPGVTQWAAGDRSGANVTVVTSSVPLLSAIVTIADHQHPPASSPAGVSNGVHSRSATRTRTRIFRRAVSPRRAHDILLRCCRLNV